MKMRLVDGYVVDLAEEPEALFHPTIAAEFVDVPKGAPAGLRPGYQFDGKSWTAPDEPGAPVAVEAGPTYRTTMSPVRFRAQFGIQAKVAIRRARAYVDGTLTDAKADAAAKDARDVLEELFADLDDPRLLEVDVADPDVIEGIDFVHSLNFITEEHAERIKLGIQDPA
jgi:hypothetical protein